MKTYTTLLFSVLICSGLLAQPVIQNGNNTPPIGFSTPISISTNSTTEGAAGADQVWNYANLTFSPMGQSTVIDVGSSAYGSSFPDANFCMITDLGGANVYTYQNYGQSEMEEYAAFISAPGSGQDYSPNPVTRLIFPMSYGSTATDIWQKIGHDPNPVTISYDGYGTFISPYNTYTNVVRIANDFGENEVDYSWYHLNPLRLLAVRLNSDNKIILFDGVTTDITENPSVNNVFIYPNPVTTHIYIECSHESMNRATFELCDILGKVVLTKILEDKEENMERGELPAGIYLYRISTGSEILNTGKLIFE